MIVLVPRLVKGGGGETVPTLGENLRQKGVREYEPRKLG